MADADSGLSISGQLSADILVVGGGIMGLWGAVKAADAGLSVIMIDAGAIGGGASGGLLGALFPWMPDRWDAKKQYQFDALTSLPGEIARLEGETGLSANFRRSGRIVPLPKSHLAEIARRHERDACENWHQGGYEFDWHVREGAAPEDYIDPSTCAAGYVFDTLAARVEPRALVRLLKTWLARRHNVRIVEHAQLERLDAKKGRAEISTAHPPGGRSDVASASPQMPPISPLDGEMSRSDRGGYPLAVSNRAAITFSHALVAAGAASFPILQSLMPRLPKPLGHGVKGQAALLKADLDPALPVVFLDGIYVVPHEGGYAAVGSTSENHYADPSSTDALLDDVIEGARAVVPALREAPVVERWAGIRPKAIGRDPMVGPVPGHPNVIALTGGFKISFGVAHRLADSALDEVLGRIRAPLPANFTLAGQIGREMVAGPPRRNRSRR